jgi:HD-GYP domain-containing protein (c-di-GMP phosphodiesterase class II)/ribonuclease BN (tRNA processing enzyme)
MQNSFKNLNANELLELIFKYITDISSSQDYDEILELLADMGRALTNADRCSVWMVSDDKQEITTKIAHGIEPITIAMGSGIVGSAIETGEKIIIEDVYSDKRFNTDIDKQSGYKTKSMLVVPMYDNNHTIIGAFQVINRQGEQEYFNKRDIKILTLVSTYAAETIVALKLEQEVIDTQKEVVFTMGAIGESRSKETGNHVKRVAEYSKILALAYGIEENEAEILKDASPMHDIGKIAIPDKILNKPTYLNEYERKIMDSHTELGYEMIKNSQRPLLKAAAIVAHEHHEKWDGSGYPRGLSGEDIHIYGRITALADVFDALGSDRVYKRAWSDNAIFDFIKRERGKHFDPILVDLFFENREAIFRVREKFGDNYDVLNNFSKDKESIKILGAYGTKASGYGTSSIALNGSTVIDAGNLLDALGDSSVVVEHIWLTHSHLDHIVDIAYILDNYFVQRKKKLYIYGLPETIKAVKGNFLNDTIWPDFSQIALVGSEDMAIEYKEISLGERYILSGGESLEPFETDHTVASCGYIYTKNGQTIMIATDTYSLDNIIYILDKREDIDALIVECSFPNSMEALAKESKHLTSALLFNQLKKLKRRNLQIYINHIKPIYIDIITEEIREFKGDWQVKIVKDEEFLYF